MMRLRFPAESLASHSPGAARAPDTAAREWLGRFEISSGMSLVILVAVLLAVNVAFGFPGTMMNDSNNQYAEAVSGRFTDWHPPVMAWLWARLRTAHDGPALLFVLHLAVYWFAIGLIGDAVRRLGQRQVALAVVLAGAFPPFVFMNANVIKDVGMAVALLAGAAILFWFRAQGRKVPAAAAVAAALMLAYGTLVRTNAVFACGPLVLYALAPVHWQRNMRIVAASIAISIAAIPASQAVNRALFHPIERHAVDSLFLFDLIGIAAQEHAPKLVEPRARMDDETLQRCYTAFWWDTFSSWGPCGRYVQRPDGNHATYGDGLAEQWLHTIAQHPRAYAEHRLKHFNSELFFAVPLKHLRLTPEYRVNDPHFRPFEVFSPWNIRLDLARKNPSTWPVTWLVWGAVLALFLARHPPAPAVLLARALVFSAIGYTLGYLPVGVATDFRYHYWSMLATVFATLVVTPQLVRAWRRRDPTLAGGLAMLAVVVAVGLATRLFDFQGWIQ